MASSVLRRYTPPTCTLEVAAIGSALSRWTERAVLKNLRFELSFDDPTLVSDQPIMIRGDRNQLEALWAAVSGYVQTILVQPVEALSQGEAPAPLSGSRLAEESDLASHRHEAGINLQAKGKLKHELHLGTLASEAAAVIPLTTLQLFDLANALDAYHAEALTLPSLGRPRWLKTVPAGWMQVAAAAVLVVGVTVPVVKFITDLSAPQTTTASTKDVEISTAHRAGDLPAPLAPGTTPPPLTLTPLRPTVPLPPVGTTVFPAPVPGVAAAPAIPSTPRGKVPVQPTTIEIPAEPALPAIPNRPPETLTSETPPRLEGTDGANGSAQSVPQPSPEVSSGVANTLAAAGLATPEPNAALSANGRSVSPVSNNQADEVKAYFQQKWQPPEGLTERLEYRLLLNPDGSLQRILPLGDASANFLDRTNMPLLGEPFVSPTTDDRKPQIRVVLEPDGKVQTFLEYAN